MIALIVKVVHATARKHIPRGYRNNYVPGLTTYMAEKYNEYTQLYAAATITAGDELAQALTVEQRKTWQTLIENTEAVYGQGRITTFRMPIYPMLNQRNANPTTPNSTL